MAAGKCFFRKDFNVTAILLVMIAALIGIDQLIKFWAVDKLKPVESMEFIHFGDFRVIDLTYLENRGAIFGSMAGQRWFLIGFTSLIIAAGTVLMFKYSKKSRMISIIIALFIAGGIGNLIDRVRFGYVVDMFDIQLFDFAIFNFADICVTVAFVMMIIYLLFIEPKIAKKLKEDEAVENEQESKA